MPLTGRCLCGDIQYELASAPAMSGVCHCKNCQRQAGSAYSTIAGLPRADFKLTSGTLKLYADSDTESGSTVERWFCGNCGSPIYSAPDPGADTVYIKTGTLDDTSSFKPMFHVWCDSKQNWVTLEEGVPAIPRQGG